jgi:hypothetical protein
MVWRSYLATSSPCLIHHTNSWHTGSSSRSRFTTVGVCNWTVPANISQVDVLVVGGGGGGGGTGGRTNWSAGGGAGGFVTPKTGHGVTSGSVVAVTVGAGGLGGGIDGVDNDAKNANVPQEGGKSIFGNVEADGGGRAAAAVINRTNAQTIIDTGPTKGGGGGGQATIIVDQGAFREGSTGLKGGAGHRAEPQSEGLQAAGGGAGAGKSGEDATAGKSGNGGDGFKSAITGTRISTVEAAAAEKTAAQTASQAVAVPGLVVLVAVVREGKTPPAQMGTITVEAGAVEPEDGQIPAESRVRAETVAPVW